MKPSLSTSVCPRLSFWAEFRLARVEPLDAAEPLEPRANHVLLTPWPLVCPAAVSRTK
ncbi:hypothetical protein BCF44_107285 [Kutzneria buriramensis]|uniref:Uncharacterized protein n=1 Tax=Kutzneria buriramensis TaxID=1045776 RepID=A0A3E0HID3_9PSEU|nr:hypothetical protein BCF44_107285 [Kutzneria buriramensis]